MRFQLLLLTSLLLLPGSILCAVIIPDSSDIRLQAEAHYKEAEILMRSNGDKSLALECLLKTKHLLDQVHTGDDSLKAEAMHRIGLLYARILLSDSSRYFQQAALDMKIRCFQTDVHISVIRSYNDLAGWYAGSWDYQQSVLQRKKALSLAEQLPPNEEVINEMIKLNNNLGALYTALSDHEMALPYYMRAIDFCFHQPTLPHSITTLYTNVARSYLATKDYEKALHYCHLADGIFKQDTTRKNRDNYWPVLGDTYLLLGKPDSALVYYQNELEYQQQRLNSNPRLIAVGHNLLAKAFFALQQYDSAHVHANHLLEIEHNISGDIHSQLVDGYRLRGMCFKKQNQYSEALNALHKSLAANNYDGDIHTIISYDLAFISFQEIAEIYYDLYKRNSELEAIEECIKYLNLADEAILKKRKSLKSTLSKEIFSSNYYNLYEFALMVCGERYQATGKVNYIQQALRFSERIKNMNLADELHLQKAALMAEIPYEWIDKERSIKKEISDIKENCINNPSHESHKNTGDIYRLDRELDGIMEMYRVHYPNYYNMISDAPELQISEIQDYCKKENTTIISYALRNNKIYTFEISPANVEMYVQPIPPDFEEMIERFSLNISRLPSLSASHSAHTKRMTNMAKDGFDLYQILFPTQIEMPPRVIIVPDGDLSYISFGALPASTVPDSKLFYPSVWDYLIKKHAIFYSYSVTSLFLMENNTVKTAIPSHSFWGIAPDFSSSEWHATDIGNRTQYPVNLKLRHNQTITKKIAKIFSAVRGTYSSTLSATRDNFIKNANLYRILHFSTHAFYFPHLKEPPFFALISQYPDRRIEPVFTTDIIRLRLSADMVMLNGCGTATGNLSATEGINSLGKSFAYAGAKSVFSTLWSIKDNAGNALLQELFYQNIQKGMPKDISLQKAQLEFITSDALPFSELADPYYWSAILGHGSRKSISF